MSQWSILSSCCQWYLFGEEDLTLSVPQGGCASAFYFIMYADTLFLKYDVNCFGFADDYILNKSL